MFRTPEYIMCLLLLPLIAFLYSLAQKRRRIRLSKFNRTDTSPAPSYAILFLTLLLFALGLSRPYSGKEEFPIGKPRAGTMLVVDISQSMQVQDVSPNRLRLTKRKLQDLVQAVRKDVPGLRIGITLFAGASYVYCPPTEDYTLLEVFIRSIQPKLITNPGSALEEALLQAARSLTQSKFNSKSVVLYSDGEDFYMNIDKAIKALAMESVPIVAVGVGTEAGAPVPLPRSRSQFYKDQRGNTVMSKLSTESLTSLARETGGVFTPVSIGDQDTTLVSSFLKRHHKKQLSIQAVDDGEEQTHLTIFHELGSWLAVGLLMLFFVTTYSRHRYASLWMLLLILQVPRVSLAQESSPGVSDSVLAYQKGDFETARSGFLKKYQSEGKAFQDVMRLAATEYRLGNYSQASKYYEEAQSLATNGRELYQSLYDHGNALLHDQQFDPAIERYKKALKVKNQDPKASFNMALAEKLKKQKPPQQQDKDKKQEQKQDQKKQDQSEESQSDSKKDEKQDKQQQENQSEQDKDSDNQSSEQEQKDPSGDEEEDENSQDQKDRDQDRSDQQDRDTNESENEDKQDKEDQGEEEEENQDNQDKDEDQNNSSEQEEDQEQGGQGDTEQDSSSDPTEIDSTPARAWLDSLPDSPLIIRSYRGKGKSQGGQLW